jgi:hypothetical protein
MVRRFVAVGVLLVAVLGAPRASEAGLIDFIWEMSGPQLIGAGYGCLFTTKFKSDECRIGGVAAYALDGRPDESKDRFFWTLNGAYYLSTAKDSGAQHYDWQDVQMLAFSPGVAFRSNKVNHSVKVLHGAGVTYNFLFGRNFRRFDKFGFTFTPIDVAYKRLSVGFVARLYPNGFTADEFGFGERVTYDRKKEWVLGFNVGWRLRKPCPCPEKK